MGRKKLLKQVKHRINEEYPGLVEKVVLFGARAAGKGGSYSDYDVLVVINRDFDWRLENSILDICYDINLDYDIILDVKIISSNDLNAIKGKQPYIISALESGIAL